MFPGKRSIEIALSEGDLVAAADAVKSKGLKVGVYVTNGAIVGRIESIDPQTSDVRVWTGLRTVGVSPLVLEPI